MSPRSARSFLLCTGLCLLVLLTGAASQSSNGPTVTSVSGCVDVGATTVNCTLPALLTVRGSGFLTNISGSGPLYSNSPQNWINPRLELSPAAAARGSSYPLSYAEGRFPVNDTYFVFEVRYLGQGVLTEGVPLSLTVVLNSGGRQQSTSEPFVAVTLRSAPPPSVDSISGCPEVGADGQSVAQCLPDWHVITLTGSGFLQWQRTPLRLAIGTVHTSLYLQRGTSLISTYILNDTTLTVRLDNFYAYLLAAHDFGAPPLPFYITETLSGWRSKEMTVQFVALPPPSVAVISSYTAYNLPSLPACKYGVNGTLVNCTAGYSGIRILGYYLYEVVATIDGQPLSVMLRAQQDVKLINLVTPLYNFQPGVMYDLVLTAAGGNITVPNYVSFSGVPAIVSAACRDPLLPIDITRSLGCQVGETVTLNGPYLPPAGTAFNVNIYSATLQQNVSCSNPRYLSEYQLACDMLAAGPAYEAYNTWYLEWENGVSVTIPDRYGAWDFPNAPRIRSVSTLGGCGNVVQTSNVTLASCQGGELLQLYGTNFLSNPFTMIIQPSTADDSSIYQTSTPTALCEPFIVVSDTYATCVLPRMDDSNALQYDTPYMLMMWNRTVAEYGMRSNALFFTIASSGSGIDDAPASSSSSPSLALLVALPVALGVLAVVLVVATVRQLRSKARSTRRGPNAEPTDVYGEQKEAEHKQAESSSGSGGGWWPWRSTPTLASLGEVRSVELTES